ncbi:hypothetical protein THRCLA_08557 [Thraustotheca clavata]|uniref:Protein kinase domain-containing protein n=1 Tax=Thraustotheca clavata TaxID=74557 RepID=A0A1V9Z508_9STRA|nr:hypothetical protein THRCLA_08557 [Thraustotheca clavata]
MKKRSYLLNWRNLNAKEEIAEGSSLPGLVSCPSCSVCMQSNIASPFKSVNGDMYSCDISAQRCNQCLAMNESTNATAWMLNASMWTPLSSFTVDLSSTVPSTLFLSGAGSEIKTYVESFNLAGLTNLKELYINGIDLSSVMKNSSSYQLPSSMSSLSFTDCNISRFYLPSNLLSLESLTIASTTSSTLNLTALNSSSARSTLRSITILNSQIEDVKTFARILASLPKLTSLTILGSNFVTQPVSKKTMLQLIRLQSVILDGPPDNTICPFYSIQCNLGNSSLCVYISSHYKLQNSTAGVPAYQIVAKVTAWIIIISISGAILYGIYQKWCPWRKIPKVVRRTRAEAVIDSLLDTQYHQVPQRRSTPTILAPIEASIDTILSRTGLPTVPKDAIVDCHIISYEGPNIEVSRGFYTSKGIPVLIKQMAGYESYLLGIAKTISSLVSLDHPRIAKLQGLIDTTESSTMAVFINDVPSLSQNYKNFFEYPWTTVEKKKLALNLAEALLYIHESHIVHGHLTASTVLLDRNGNASINTLDLLSSEVYAAHNTDALYVAPEIIRRNKGTADDNQKHVRFYSKAADVYAFGVLLAEIDMGDSAKNYLVHKCLSFQEKEMPVAQLLNLRHALTFNPGIFQHVIALCLHEDPTSRPTIATVVDLLSDNHGTIIEASGELSSYSMGKALQAVGCHLISTLLTMVAVADMDLWERESAPMFQYAVHSGDRVTQLTAIQGQSICTSEQPEFASHGHCVWDAALVLSEYLQHINHPWKQAIELGAGVGLVGMTLAALGCKDVILTDQAYCLPLLEKNVEVNFKGNIRPRIEELQWGENMTTLCPDLIVASDILYNIDVFPVLISTLSSLSTPSTTIFMAFESRNAKIEKAFLEMLVNTGFTYSLISLETIQKRISTIVPYPEEIFVYHITKS